MHSRHHTDQNALEFSLRSLQLVGQFAWFLGSALIKTFRPPFFLREILDATALVLIRCLIPVIVTVAPFAMVVSLHGALVFRLFSAERMLGMLIGICTLRELAPNLAGILIAAQAGSAFAAELAAMRAQEEIDATLVMGVDPIKFHVVPRLLGITLAAPILTILGCAAGVVGGWFLAVVIMGHDSGAFLDNLFTNLAPFDLYSAIIKAGAFGLVIGTVACFFGYTSKGTTLAVGQAVNNTVVYSITLFLVLNYFLSSALFGLVS